MSQYGNRGGYGGQNRPGGYFAGRSQTQAQPPVNRKLDDNYVDTAESVIRAINATRCRLSNSKLRNLLSMVSDVNNELVRATGEEIPPELMNKIRHFRVRLVYEIGRGDEGVREFARQADLLRILREDIGTSRKAFLRFADYMEAMVAYHRYYGGKD
jgi:CRISPR-associated protein Csm2